MFIWHSRVHLGVWYSATQRKFYLQDQVENYTQLELIQLYSHGSEEKQENSSHNLHCIVILENKNAKG